jgi:hypothetical protein
MRNFVVGLAVVVAALVGCTGDGGDPVVSDTIPADTDVGGSSSPEVGDSGDADGAPSELEEPPTVGSVCELATSEEISSVVGNEVIAVDIDATLCEYSLVDGAPAADGTTVDLFMNAASEETCELEFGLVGADNGQPVDGLGTAAYWSPGSPTAQLFVCTGGSFVTITQYKPSTVTDDRALARAQEISNIVLGRL